MVSVNQEEYMPLTSLFLLKEQPIKHSCVFYCLNTYLTIQISLLDLCASSLLPGHPANWDFARFIALLCLVSTALAVLKSILFSLVFLLQDSSDVAPMEDLPERPDCPRGCPRHSDDNRATLPANRPTSWEPRGTHTHTDREI